MTAPAVPPYGLTMQAPWTALIAWGTKRIENRSTGVASTIGDYRGPVALTASKSHTIDSKSRPFFLRGKPNREVFEDLAGTLDALGPLRYMSRQPVNMRAVTLREIAALAGHWFAVADIVSVRDPKPENDGWHAAGRHGIVLANVRVLDNPEPATGGQGFFAFARCGRCDRPRALGSRHMCGTQRPG